MTTQETFNNFILSRCLADFSPKTVLNYKQFVAPFINAIGPESDFQNLTQADISTYISKFVFVSRNGLPLTGDAVKHMITKAASRLNFELSSHKLRHNFATNYCIDQYTEYGQVDIYSLMHIMGHEDLSTTQRYLHYAQEILASRTHVSHLDKLSLTF